MHKITKLMLVCFMVALLACTQKKTILANDEEMQYMITTTNGHKILIDTSNLKNIPEKIGEEDVLVSTHKAFWEPFVAGSQCFLTTNVEFAQAFPGHKLDAIPGTVTLNDAVIVSISSSRRLENSIDPENADNYIIVVTTGGMKFVFLGFLGQETLNDSQMEWVRNADFLFLSTFNQWGDHWPVSTLYRSWIDQINPRFIVPTVYGTKELKSLCSEFSVYYPGKDLNNLNLSAKSLSSCKTPAVLVLRSQITSLVKSFLVADKTTDQKKSGVLPGN